MSTKRVPGLTKCPWCKVSIDLAWPLLDPSPEYARVSRYEIPFDNLIRLAEKGDCPHCREPITVSWYGGFRWR
jgi:hypothetical protein